MTRAGALLALAVGGVVSAPATAAERRYAVIVGADTGGPGDGQLYFAERDAERMAEVLTALGGVNEEDLVLLRGATADRLRAVLDDVAARAASTPAHDDTLLVVFYSGHADATSLHLGASTLPFDDLLDAVRAVPVDLAVLVVDACRSGGLTRVRGAAPAEPFQIVASDPLDSRGLAILTSSSSGEDAQESDRLEGGFFTHHLVAGLRGVADSSGDGAVTLTEAYRYSNAQTLLSTSGQRELQHPTYAFDLRGRSDPVLTRVQSDDSGARLELHDSGAYLLFTDDDERGLVAELSVEDRATVALPPGRYLLRRRGADTVHEARVRVGTGEVTALSVADMDVVPYGRTVRRGYAARRRAALAWVADAGVIAPPATGLGVGPVLATGLRVDLEPLTLWARGRFEHHGADGIDIAVDHRALGADLEASKLYDVGPVAVGLGVRFGLDRVTQRFETVGSAPPRAATVGRGGPVARAELALLPRVAVGLTAGVEGLLLPGDGRPTTELAPHVGLVTSVYLP